MLLFRVALILVMSAFTVCCGAQKGSGTTDARIRMMPDDTVRLFATGVISTPFNERDLAMRPDGKELMYTLNTTDNSRRAIIMVTLDKDKVISRSIAPFSGRYADIEPFYAPDGQRVYFSSSRPVSPQDSTADYNIWYVDRTADGWSRDAYPLSPVINTEADEYYPSVASNGNLYFTAAYKSGVGREDIYVSILTQGAYTEPTPLNTHVNSANYEFNAYVSPAEDVLIFTSYGRQDDMGGGDLYLSTKDPSGHWGKARHLGSGINSPKIDYCPFIDFSKSAFYFTSNRTEVPEGPLDLPAMEKLAGSITNGLGNIYVVHIRALGLTSH